MKEEWSKEWIDEQFHQLGEAIRANLRMAKSQMILRSTPPSTEESHALLEHTRKLRPQMEAREAARRWRERQSEYTPPHATDYTTGWVIVHNGAGAGWTRELEHRPCAWVPGCLAVPADDGPVYIAVGGNAQSGAERWEVMP